MLVPATGPHKAGDDAILPLDHTKQGTMLVSVAGPHKAGTMLYCRWTTQSRGRCYTAAGPHKAGDDAILPLDHIKQGTMLYCRWTT